MDVLAELVKRDVKAVLVERVDGRKRRLQRLARHEATRKEEGEFHECQRRGYFQGWREQRVSEIARRDS
jgi:hypothetical protein